MSEFPLWFWLAVRLGQIVTSLTKRVTTQDTPCATNAAGNRAIFFDRFNKIVAARRMKAALSSHKRA